MSMKKDLVSRKEVERCIEHISGSNNSLAQEPLLKLLQEMQIILDDPKVEDSIDGTRIHVTYTVDMRRKRGGRTEQDAIRFQYMKEIPIDYNNVPIRLRVDNTTSIASPVDHNTSHNDNVVVEDTIIESYDEIEKGIPTLYEVLGLLKRIYFLPEDFSNRLVVNRIHKL